MKSFFTLIMVAVAMATVFTSCEQDAPEINFSQTDTHISDFSGIIAAINSQTTTLEAKLQLINDAINAQTLSFEQKMDILQAAVDNGILTYIEQSELLIAAINNQTTDLAAKLVLIERAITSQTLSLEAKLQLLTEAAEAGFISLEEAMQLMITAINNQTTDLSAKLVLIQEAITSQTLSLEAKLQLLTEAVEAGFISETAAITAMNTALALALEDMMTTMTTNTATLEAAINALNSDTGIYSFPGNQNALYLRPSVWEAIKDSQELTDAILSTITAIEPVVTVDQILPDGHDTTHVITPTRTSINPPELLSMLDNTSIQIGGVNQELIKVISMFTAATYDLYKESSCNLFFFEIYITDARGTEERYNFNGSIGNTGKIGPAPGIEVYFAHDGNVVTEATITANMHR